MLPEPTPRAVQFALGGIGLLSLGLMVVMTVLSLQPALGADQRAIIRMGALLMVLWVGIFGPLSWVLQKGIPEQFTHWRVKFFVFATFLACIEEAMATGLTNLGPALGAASAAAHITASPKYLEVVLLHSVIMFMPMFAAWTWLLGRWRFSPPSVLLLFGLTGTLGEVLMSGYQSILQLGMWVWVYGLMVYLPAHLVPAARMAEVPRWYHYPLAVIVPIIAALPLVPPLTMIRSFVHPG